MIKSIFIFLIIFTLAVFKTETISADYFIAEPSAQLKEVRGTKEEDYRIGVLRNFFEEYNSPLSEYAEHFISTADKYHLDWRLVPAITGIESTFGKRMPQGSFNAYGWANGDYRFSSWETSIEIVSKTLREKYLNRGATTIEKIARRYAPPSKTWAGKVKYFMNEIDPLPLEFTI